LNAKVFNDAETIGGLGRTNAH
jgi:hypothetical protein